MSGMRVGDIVLSHDPDIFYSELGVVCQVLKEKKVLVAFNVTLNYSDGATVDRTSSLLEIIDTMTELHEANVREVMCYLRHRTE